MHNKKLFLFRHGQTDWNTQGIIQGHTDIPLNNTGRHQAELLGKSLQDKQIEVIVSSDLGRAAETASIVGNFIGCSINYDVNLREAHAGIFQGKPSTLARTHPIWPQWDNIDVAYDMVALPGGETKLAIKQRFLQVVNRYLTETDYQRIAISSHGIALKLALQALTNNAENCLHLSNATYVQLSYDPIQLRWVIIEKPE